jgi:Fic family protein
MRFSALQILPVDLLEPCVNDLPDTVQEKFEALEDCTLSIDTFSFYTSVSAVFSSKIEGEPIELDSYIKHKRMGAHFLPDYTRKIDDLYDTYQFAQTNTLNPANLSHAHALLTKHILQPAQQGRFITGNMFVVTPDGKIEYVAALPAQVEDEMQKFYNDLLTLLTTDLSFEEVFFFASLLHLVFLKIHPFEDGNRRTVRLIEKWFLAEKLGTKAWFVQSERYYYSKHQAYYNTIRALGLEYDLLDYSAALPFLRMLGNSIFK